MSSLVSGGLCYSAHGAVNNHNLNRRRCAALQLTLATNKYILWFLWLLTLHCIILAHASLVLRDAAHENLFSLGNFKSGARVNITQGLNLYAGIGRRGHNNGNGKHNGPEQCKTPGNSSLNSVATVKEGGVLELRCAIADYDQSKRRTTKIFWDFSASGSRSSIPVRLSKETDSRVKIVTNGPLSTLYLSEVREEDSGVYKCSSENSDAAYLCARTVTVGGPPMKYVNLTCESFAHENFACKWGRGDDYLDFESRTRYELSWYNAFTKDNPPCQVSYDVALREWGCPQGINERLPKKTDRVPDVLPVFDRHQAVTINITAVNPFGSQSWIIPSLRARDHVRTRPPSGVKAVPLGPNSISVSWKNDYYYTDNSDRFLYYQVQVRSQYDLEDNVKSYYRDVTKYYDEFLPDGPSSMSVFALNSSSSSSLFFGATKKSLEQNPGDSNAPLNRRMNRLISAGKLPVNNNDDDDDGQDTSVMLVGRDLSSLATITTTTSAPVESIGMLLSSQKAQLSAYKSDDDDILADAAVGRAEKWVTVATSDHHLPLFIRPGPNGEATPTNITVAGLLPYTLYQFRVRSHPVENGYWGAFSNATESRTATAKPRGSVQPIPGAFEVVTSNITHQRMTIYWTALAPWNRNGQQFFYEVSVEHFGGGYQLPQTAALTSSSNGKNQHPQHLALVQPSPPAAPAAAATIVHASNANATFLYVGGQYQVAIRPVNEAGSGSTTKIVVQKADAIHVTRVTIVKHVEHSAFLITIRWSVATAAAAGSAAAGANGKSSSPHDGPSASASRSRVRRQVDSNGGGGETAAAAPLRHDIYTLTNATVYYCIAATDPSPITTEHTCISHLMYQTIPLSLQHRRERKVQTSVSLPTSSHGEDLKYQFAVGVSGVKNFALAGSVSASSSSRMLPEVNHNNNHNNNNNDATVHSGLKWASCLILPDLHLPEFEDLNNVATENASLQISWRLQCEDRAGLVDGYKIYVILCPAEIPDVDKPSYCVQALPGGSLNNLPQTTVVETNSVSAMLRSAKPNNNNETAGANNNIKTSPATAAASSPLLITEEESLNHNYATDNDSFVVFLKISDRTAFAVKGLLPMRKYVIGMTSVSPNGLESELRLGKLIVETTEQLWPKDSGHDNTIMIIGILLGLFLALMIVCCACCWKRFRKLYREAKAEFRNIKLPEPSLMQMTAIASAGRQMAAAAAAAGSRKHSLLNDNYYAQVPGGNGVNNNNTGAAYVDAQRLVGNNTAAAAAFVAARQLSVTNGYGPAGVERLYITKFEDPEVDDDDDEDADKNAVDCGLVDSGSDEINNNNKTASLLTSPEDDENEDENDEGVSLERANLLKRSTPTTTTGDGDAAEEVKRQRTPGGGQRYSPLPPSSTVSGGGIEMVALNNSSNKFSNKSSELVVNGGRFGRRLRSFGARAAATFRGTSSSGASSSATTTQATAAGHHHRRESESSSSSASQQHHHQLNVGRGEDLKNDDEEPAAAAAAEESQYVVESVGKAPPATERSYVAESATSSNVPLLIKSKKASSSRNVVKTPPVASLPGEDVVDSLLIHSSNQQRHHHHHQEPRPPSAPPGTTTTIAKGGDKDFHRSVAESEDKTRTILGWLSASDKALCNAKNNGVDDRDSSSSTLRGGAAAADGGADDDDDVKPETDTPPNEDVGDTYKDSWRYAPSFSNNAAFSGSTNISEYYMATRGAADVEMLKKTAKKSTTDAGSTYILSRNLSRQKLSSASNHPELGSSPPKSAQEHHHHHEQSSPYITNPRPPSVTADAGVQKNFMCGLSSVTNLLPVDNAAENDDHRCVFNANELSNAPQLLLSQTSSTAPLIQPFHPTESSFSSAALPAPLNARSLTPAKMQLPAPESLLLPKSHDDGHHHYSDDDDLEEVFEHNEVQQPSVNGNNNNNINFVSPSEEENAYVLEPRAKR